MRYLDFEILVIFKTASWAQNETKWANREIKRHDKFTYLGGILNKHSGTDANGEVRIGRVKAAFLHMENIWA